MTTESENPAAQFNAARFLPVLLLLFAGSGCSALIYEIVWYHLLQLAIGSTAVSLGVLLATFMGGLCIGSIWFPRLRLAKQHPLRIYAFLEMGIAICGLLVLCGAFRSLTRFMLPGPSTACRGCCSEDLLPRSAYCRRRF